jgi:acyl dehydratase
MTAGRDEGAGMAADAREHVQADAPAGKRWYFEDFYAGQEIDLGERAVTEAEILDFARAFDPQSFHVDAGAAQQSPYGGLIASGWHTCSMMMRMVVDGLLSAADGMGSPGLDGVRWLQPVRAGDTLRVRYLTRQVKASSSKPDRGVVWSTWTATNQHGDQVCTVDGIGLYGRRPSKEQ